MENRRNFHASQTCPYVGMRDDPHTCYAYPTAGNYCAHCQPPAVPLLEHQGSYCLNGDYRDCPAYRQAASLPFPLPQEGRNRSRGLRILKSLARALRRPFFPRGR